MQPALGYKIAPMYTNILTYTSLQLYCPAWVTKLRVSAQNNSRLKNNRQPSAIFCALQLYDRLNTCLLGHCGRPEAPLVALLVDWFTMCLIINTIVSLLTRMFDNHVLAVTTITTEWAPNSQSDHAMSRHLSLHFGFLISDSAIVKLHMLLNAPQRSITVSIPLPLVYMDP